MTRSSKLLLGAKGYPAGGFEPATHQFNRLGIRFAREATRALSPRVVYRPPFESQKPLNLKTTRKG